MGKKVEANMKNSDWKTGYV